MSRPVATPKVDSKLSLDLNAVLDASKGAGLVYFKKAVPIFKAVLGAGNATSRQR